MIHFRIAMTPRGQGRPKARAFNGIAQVYKDSKSRVHEATIASLAAPYRPASPLVGPLSVRLLVITPRPAGLNPISKRTGQPTRDLNRMWNVKKPDVDNYAKAVLDGLEAFWGDDCQVVDLHVKKVIAEYGEAPGFAVWIDEATDAAVPHGEVF